eukprot:TRINITY_DN10829_c0_g1_i1.p1 TRINITY_DN10829_c0_g1~~TRINITY_DN10829_c0_g1_i1.p1  ORF type:complete len:439 (-),score=70.79 TRINITY_DN10829_c0_g1_i1:75-1391(-)
MVGPVRALLAVFLLVCLLGCCWAAETRYFEQPVDHLNVLNTDTFQQKYIVRHSTSNRNAPVFLFLGGEAPVEFFQFQEVSAEAWAQEFGATYISLEHRYYGSSNVTDTLETPNLQYLSSQQALMDAANFILAKKSQLRGPWVVLGCSYSGALSAWFRSKYPNLVVGSISPSGPLLAVENFYGLLKNFQLVAEPSCVAAAKTAVDQITSLLASPSGRKTLQSAFHTCKPIDSDPRYFKWAISQWLATTAQWENPPAFAMQAACKALTQSSDVVANWGAAMAADVGGSCNPVSISDYLGPLMNSTELNNMARTWEWQKCSNLGYFQTSTHGSSIFFDDLSLDFLLDFCRAAFGEAMRPRVGFSNAYYGGLDLQGSNIFVTNGLKDPWHRLGLIESKGGITVSTYEAGHCAPMTAPTAVDPPSLTQTREEIRAFLKQLLKK